MLRTLLVASAMLLLLLPPAAAKTVNGYRLPARYPTTKLCRDYQRRHSGVERWRLWVRRYAYRQARLAGQGNWHYVWNENWVLRVIERESGGNPACTLGPHRGLLQIRADHAPRSNLYAGPVNIAVGAQLFARLGPQPWACTMNVGLSPYAAQ
jgi:hypothetical protein